jgi:hypothetical protein
MPKGRALVVIVAVLFIVALQGCGGSSGRSDAEKDEIGAIDLYCFYGSQSRTQFRGCTHHVSFEEITERAKEGIAAGEFALGITTICEFDAGPMCERARAIVKRTTGYSP